MKKMVGLTRIVQHSIYSDFDILQASNMVSVACADSSFISAIAVS